MSRAAALAAVLLGCALFSPDLRSQSAQQPPATFRAGIDVVQMDVSVLDRNRQPVKGLTAADFTVLENGVVQPIVAFDFVDIPAPAEPPAPWMRDASPDLVTNEKAARRVVVIVMDDAFVPLDPAVMKNAKQIARAVIDRLGPTDLAAVTFTDSGRRQDITNDRSRLLAAIESFVPHPAMRAPPDPMSAARSSGGSLASSMGRGGLSPCSLRGKFRSIAACVVDTFITAGEALQSAPLGRKTLVYISAGPPLDFSMTDMRGALPPPGEEVTAVQAVLRSFHEANINVYAVDPSGVTPAGIMGPGLDALRIFAEDTGGRATINTNTPWDAVPQIFLENGSYYMLGIRSGSDPGRSRFHRIQVKVNRPGLEVRTRSGYYNRAPENANAAAASPVDAALALAVPGGELPLGVTVAPIAIPGEKSAALLVVTGLREPLKRSADGHTLELATMALDGDCGDCKALPSTRQTVRLTTASGAAAPGSATAASRPVEILSRLMLPPGSYEIRVAASLEGRSGGVFTHVDVPDFRKAPLSASGLILSAPGSTEAVQTDALPDVLPLVPTSLREFRANVAATAWLRLYQGGSKAPGAVRVTATIVDAAGKTDLDRTTFLESVQFSRDRAADYRLDLPISTLEAGPHLLTIEAHLGDNVVRRQTILTVR